MCVSLFVKISDLQWKFWQKDLILKLAQIMLGIVLVLVTLSGPKDPSVLAVVKATRGKLFGMETYQS